MEKAAGIGQDSAADPGKGLAQIDSGEMQQVEAEEDHGHVLVGRGDLALGLQLGAILERREGRFAARVERHDLAVEDHAVCGLLAELRGEPGKVAESSSPRRERSLTPCSSMNASTR